MTVDTNIIIGYLNGDKPITDAVQLWRGNNVSLFLSAIVEAEVLSLSGLTYEERVRIQEFLEENFIPISFDRTIARIAADIRRQAKIKLPDAAIAATALSTHTPVVTRNHKDFRRVKNLQIIEI